jgi:hypothetical protein
VAKSLEKIPRDFLWVGLGDEFKFDLVNRNVCCALASYGGFGIKKLMLFNEALLGKWLWRYRKKEICYGW